MKNELNYPIKYAVLGIKEQEDEIVAYIAEKVYVISEKVEYFKDGTSKKKYQVVFPFKNRKDYKTGGVTPEFTHYNQCYNSDIIDDLYDSYEEAKSISSTLNKKLREDSLIGIDRTIKGWPEKIMSKQRIFDQKLAIYEDLELAIASLEIGMLISEEPVLSNSSLSR